jgi:hypothetical protein
MDRRKNTTPPKGNHMSVVTGNFKRNHLVALAERILEDCTETGLEHNLDYCTLVGILELCKQQLIDDGKDAVDYED